MAAPGAVLPLRHGPDTAEGQDCRLRGVDDSVEGVHQLLAPEDVKPETVSGASFANFGSIPLIQESVRSATRTSMRAFTTSCMAARAGLR